MTVLAVVRHEGKIYMAGDRGASDDNTIETVTVEGYTASTLTIDSIGNFSTCMHIKVSESNIDLVFDN